MAVPSNFRLVLVGVAAAVAVVGCGGANDVASPGVGSFPPAPTAGSSGSTDSSGTPTECPTGTSNTGTLSGRGGVTLRVCQLPDKIRGSLTLPQRNRTVYALAGKTEVGDDRGGDSNNPITGRERGILTIDPGVTLFGSSGADFLVVNRGSQLFVNGTAPSPVIMTSRQSVQAAQSADSIGQWGGLVILGRSWINSCNVAGVAYAAATCETQVEGTSAFFGGNNPADNSGSIRYLRVMHSGFEVLPGNELNGITLAGVGHGTTFEYVQVHNSSDDGIEWFGGTVNGRYLVLTGNDDDSLDTDEGYRGTNQYGIVWQRAGTSGTGTGGDRLAEQSNKNSRFARSNPKFANFTMIARNGASGNRGIEMNTTTNSEWYNTVIVRPSGSGACINVDTASTTGTFGSVFLACATPFSGVAQTLFTAGTGNKSDGTATLTAPSGGGVAFINGANETALAAFSNLAGRSAFPAISSESTTPAVPAGGVNASLTTTTYIGGVKDAADTWWQGWTCGLRTSDAC